MVLFVLLQELLPLVLMFELPVIVQLNPDPSSPAIQHISQTYNISVAFKQRSRLYGATGVVRGSQNNAAAVKVRHSYMGASSFFPLFIIGHLGGLWRYVILRF